MAKIKLSSVGITNISGKAGGSIYSRNRGGAYVKNFAVPTNPNTTFQQNVRSIFGGIAQAWRSLTEEQRNSFNEMAPLYTAKDVFGDGLTYTGSQLHQKLNSNLMLSGQSPITSALTPAGTPPLRTLVGEAELSVGGVLSISVTPGFEIGTFDNTDFVFVISATAPHGASRTFQKNQFRYVIFRAVTVTGTEESFSAFYRDRFYSPLEGQVISVKVQMLNLRTGEISTPMSVDLTTTQSTV